MARLLFPNMEIGRLLSVLILCFSLWSVGGVYGYQKRAGDNGSAFLVGVGKADITG